MQGPEDMGRSVDLVTSGVSKLSPTAYFCTDCELRRVSPFFSGWEGKIIRRLMLHEIQISALDKVLDFIGGKICGYVFSLLLGKYLPDIFGFASWPTKLKTSATWCFTGRVFQPRCDNQGRDGRLKGEVASPFRA